MELSFHVLYEILLEDFTYTDQKYVHHAKQYSFTQKLSQIYNISQHSTTNTFAISKMPTFSLQVINNICVQNISLAFNANNL